ncbi:MAG: aminotransferase class I/II-fold pyridoxal phosphate-dependent enzyme [Acidobacteria bacterium]|nr:aminotransferase class I/II-fold pyridoxal phosphate-dependent enzyme [Acidobacteriota bacterium]
MGIFLDSLPMSGIVRIRDMMYTIQNPFRLDQGDVSFDAPDSVKQGMAKAIENNHTHYLPTLGVPRFRQLIAEKMRTKNGIPVGSDDEVIVCNGGTHGIYVALHAVLEPGDEVLCPDPLWPPSLAIIQSAHAVPVQVPVHEELGFRWNLDELEKAITAKTRAIYINSPTNPSGGAFPRSDLERIAAMAKAHDLWVFSDEAYEDVLFTGEHVSIASLPGMYERTIPIYTMSKSYAITGVRVGYIAIKDKKIRARAAKVTLYTASNVCSIAQYGGIGALEGPQDCIAEFKTELKIRRDLFYTGLKDVAGHVFSGNPPEGAFYAFVKIDRDWARDKGLDKTESVSWAVAEHIIKHGRVGCVPGVDFGPASEGYLRFCTCRDRTELTGALESMRAVFAS